MKKKMVVYCVLVSLVFILTPLASAGQHIQGVSPGVNLSDAQQRVSVGNPPEPSLRNGLLLVLVFMYTPGQGIGPFAGANITAKSLFHKYNGTTDANGVCLLKVHAPWLREKLFFVKVSIINQAGHARYRIAFLTMKAWHLAYRIFLFANI